MGVTEFNLDYQNKILDPGQDVCHVFEWKCNLTVSTVWNTGETGDKSWAGLELGT